MGSIDGGEVVEEGSDVGAVVEDWVVVVAVDMLRRMLLGRLRDVRDLCKVNRASCFRMKRLRNSAEEGSKSLKLTAACGCYDARMRCLGIASRAWSQ